MKVTIVSWKAGSQALSRSMTEGPALGGESCLEIVRWTSVRTTGTRSPLTDDRVPGTLRQVVVVNLATSPDLEADRRVAVLNAIEVRSQAEVASHVLGPDIVPDAILW